MSSGCSAVDGVGEMLRAMRDYILCSSPTVVCMSLSVDDDEMRRNE